MAKFSNCLSVGLDSRRSQVSSCGNRWASTAGSSPDRSRAHLSNSGLISTRIIAATRPCSQTKPPGRPAPHVDVTADRISDQHGAHSAASGPPRWQRVPGNRAAGHCSRICFGSLATISGCPLYSLMMPDAQMRLSRYVVSGAPNFGLSSPQMRIVKMVSGYGLSRFRNVGCPRLRSAYLALATTPHTVSPRLP